MRVMNEFTSQQNYDRNRSLIALDMLQKLRQASAGEAGLDESPEFQDAMSRLNISPASSSAALSAAPAIKFAAGMSDLTAGGASPSMEDVARIGAPAGALTAAQMLTPYARLEGAKSRVDERLQENFRKAVDDNYKMTGDFKQALEQAIITSSSGLNPADQTSLRAKAEAMAPGLSKLYESRVGKNVAQAGLADAHASAVNTLLQPQVDALTAKTALDKAHASLMGIQAQVASGTILTPTQVGSLVGHIIAAQHLMRPQAGLAGFMPADKNMQAQAAADIQVITGLLTKAGYDVGTLLKQATRGGGAAPAPAATAPPASGAAGGYSSAEDVKAAALAGKITSAQAVEILKSQFGFGD